MTALTADSVRPVSTVGAADLLTSGLCTAACLLGRESGPCKCRCGSRYHGDLRDAMVRLPVTDWWVTCAIDVRELFTDGGVGEVAGRVGDFTVGALARRPGQFQVFVLNDPGGPGWHDGGAIVADRFLDGLRRTGRIRVHNRPPAQVVSAVGFADVIEARISAALLVQGAHGAAGGLAVAVEVLEGRPFPASSRHFDPLKLADALVAGYVEAP